MLKQIFANLIGNALKFSSGRAQPVVEVGATDEDGRTVFFVKDNGVGFDMRYAGKLFSMFQRMHGDAEFPGTGVGLVLVKRLVERHHGRVWAQAEPETRGDILSRWGASAQRAPSVDDIRAKQSEAVIGEARLPG
ncbi:MAG: ATP-binding protein [Desulfobacterales bacterium]|nr:ATP-binding protein [Desulfobacterales bacterium]